MPREALPYSPSQPSAAQRRVPSGQPMPFTPFHLGPGAVFKAVGGDRFSFMVFGGSQVLIDLEPAVRMMIGSVILHGFTHTLIGALVIGTLAGAIGKPISERVLYEMNIPCHGFTWTMSFVSAYIGTFSHVLLDAVMHWDLMLLYPFSLSKPLLGLISVDWLHVLCIGCGGLGLILLFGRWVWSCPRRI